jgi:hypothetical protein
MTKSFIGLNQYQIEIPDIGWAYLFIDLTALETMLHNEAIAKLEEMGYTPTLRYWDTPDRLRPCLLLKAVQLKTDDEEPFDEELEVLFPLFENAVRSPRRPKNYCPQPATENEITLVSA